MRTTGLVIGDMMEDFPVDTRPVPYERIGTWDYDHGEWKLRLETKLQAEVLPL